MASGSDVSQAGVVTPLHVLLREQLQRYKTFLSLKESRVMRIYSLFDRKLREYGQPSLSPNDATIFRVLSDVIPGSGSTMARHPEDFDLFALGELDVETGVIRPAETPLLIENLKEILPRAQSEG